MLVCHLIDLNFPSLRDLTVLGLHNTFPTKTVNVASVCSVKHGTVGHFLICVLYLVQNLDDVDHIIDHSTLGLRRVLWGSQTSSHLDF